MIWWAIIAAVVLGTALALLLLGGARELDRLEDEHGILHTRPPADTAWRPEERAS